MPLDAEVTMPVGFSIRLATKCDIPAIRAVLFCVRSEYGVIGEIGANNADLNDLEINYFRSGGCFEVVEDAMKCIVGCAGLRPLNSCRVELCKMYIEKAAREKGWESDFWKTCWQPPVKAGFKRFFC